MKIFFKILFLSLAILFLGAVIYVVLVKYFEHSDVGVAGVLGCLFWFAIFLGGPALLFCIAMVLIGSLMEKIDNKYSVDKNKNRKSNS